MKDDSVVKTFARETLDALDMLGRQVGAQFDHHAAILQFEVEDILQIERGRRRGRRGSNPQHGQ